MISLAFLAFWNDTTGFEHNGYRAGNFAYGCTIHNGFRKGTLALGWILCAREYFLADPNERQVGWRNNEILRVFRSTKSHPNQQLHAPSCAKFESVMKVASTIRA